MKGLVRLCVVACWVVAAASQGNSQSDVRITASFGSPAARAAVRVRIYDFENVPPSILTHAEEEATDIFGKAGIAVTWSKCWPRSTRDAVCGTPFGPSDLMLRILSKPMTADFEVSPLTLGFALPTKPGRGGVTAYICYDHIRKLVHNADSSTSHILAAVSAHEVGHLLMSSDAHLIGGIMCPIWPKQDLRRGRSGYLLFTPVESELMRANLLGRWERGNGGSMRADLPERNFDAKGPKAAEFTAQSDIAEPAATTTR